MLKYTITVDLILDFLLTHFSGSFNNTQTEKADVSSVLIKYDTHLNSCCYAKFPAQSKKKMHCSKFSICIKSDWYFNNTHSANKQKHFHSWQTAYKVTNHRQHAERKKQERADVLQFCLVCFFWYCYHKQHCI